MPSNIELKARVSDPEKLRRIAEGLSDTAAVSLEQRDTFFHCPNGRLKLREFADGTGELIFYTRPDLAGTKQSNYLIAPTCKPGELHAVLSAALGARQTVKKTRVLLHVGQTRIHLDSVASLGSFVELEVVLRDGQAADEGHVVARELMAALGIRQEDLVKGAYADLLAAKQPK
jgi:predicted adenylyl cyclase CyaB